MGAWDENNFGAETISVRAVDIIDDFVLKYYSDGYSIIQELIQNANDASASDMVFSFLPQGISKELIGISLKKAKNPLLNNPLLIVMNDGPFLPKDAKYIASLGIGSKTHDDTSIGKFGLGMKSIFHMCDAFFYFTTDGEYSKFINPYIWDNRDSDHPDWNYENKEDFASDFTSLNESVKKLIKDKKKPYFCLVIPLRTSKSAAPHLKTTFYDNMGLAQLIYGEEQPKELDEFLLTMLSVLSVTSKKKTLKTVKFKSRDFDIQCTLRNNGILVENAKNKTSADSSIHCIKAIISDDLSEKFKIIQNSQTWPDNARKLNVEDASIILVKTPAQGKSELEISYASYLPFKDSTQIIRTYINSKYSYKIIFNGPFVIDAGRNGINAYGDLMYSLSTDTYEFPEDINEFRNHIDHILSKDKINAIWNTLLLKDVLYASLPHLFTKDDGTLRDNDYLAIFDAFKFSSMEIIHRYATRKYFIPCELKATGGYAYKLSEDYKALLLPDPESETLTRNNDFISLLNKAISPSRMIFTNAKGTPLGLIHPDNISRQNNLGTVYNIFSELSGSYYALLSKPTFRNYLKRFLAVILHDAEITDAYTADSIIFFIKDILKKMTAADNLVGIPGDFIDIIEPVVQGICNTVPIYVCSFDNTEASVYRKLWTTKTNILLYPASKMNNKDEYIGSKISDLRTYLQMNVKPLMESTDPELAGSIFEATVTPFVSSEEFSSVSNITLMADVFKDEKIIPAWKYSSTAREKSYISFAQLKNAYREVAPDKQKDITLFFQFAPHHCPVFAIDTGNMNRFNISAEILGELSLATLVIDDITDDSYLDPSFFEDVMIRILNVDTSDSLKSKRIFPTIDGKFTSMIGNDVYLDCRTQNDFEIRGTSGICRIIRVESDKLRKYMMRLYNSNILNDQNFLSIYLRSEISPDKEVVYACRNNWDSRNSELCKKPWFHLEGEKTAYPCTNIIRSDNISDDTISEFSDTILFVTNEQIENDPCLEALFKGHYIGERLSDIPDEIVRRKFSNHAPLFNYGTSGKASTEETSDIFDALISAQYSIENNDSMLHKWGCFLRDAIQKEHLTSNEANQRFVDYNNKIHNEQAEFNVDKDIADVLQNLSGNTEAFIYVIDLLVSKQKELDVKLFSNVRFPSESRGEWKALYSLCNYKQYPTIEPRYQLSRRIPVSLFLTPETFEDLDNDEEVETLSINSLRAIYPSASDMVLGMLLFISNVPSSRAEALDMLIAKKTDDFYLAYLKPAFTFGEPSGFTFRSLTLPELFSIKPQKVSKPSIKYIRDEVSDTNNMAKIHSITGNRISVSFTAGAEHKSIFSGITQATHGYLCHLNPWSDENTVDDRLIDLINQLLCQVYKKGDKFTQHLLPLKSASTNQMKTTQNFIKREILSILKVAPYKRGTRYGDLLDDYKNRNVEYNLDLAEAKNGSDNYNKAIQDISRLEDEIVDKLKNDSSFANYFMSILSAHASEVSYNDGSVPFEFFQNADDALLQLITYSAPKTQFFTLKFDGTNLIFEHNGRPINSGALAGKHKEWNQDLINMLTFSSSKQHSSEIIETGKFGFGFKSCYFLSEEPKLYSGALSAKIIGGVYPDYIPPAANLTPGVTRFILPLKNEKRITVKNDVIPKFSKNATYLLLFAKAITRITIDGAEYVKHTLWENKPYSIVRINDNLFLQVKGDRVSIAFKIGKDKHLTRIPDDIARVWCTTPLDIHAKHNYLINSSELKVDLGRTMIDMNLQGNKNIISEVSELFGQLLVDSYDSTLSKDIEEYLVTGPELAKDIIDASIAAEATEVFGTIFNSSYSKLIKGRNLMYNGFVFKEYGNDTQYLRLSYLNNSKNAQNEITELENILNAHCPDREVILITRDILLPEKANSRECDSFVAFIEQMNRFNNNLQPIVGNKLKTKLNQYEELYYDFSKFKFMSKSGKFCDAHSLVCEDDNEYAFAPNSCIISSDYIKELKCKFIFHPSTVASWILKASGMAQKTQALIYLARHNHTLSCEKQLFDSMNWPKKEYKQYLSHIDSNDANTLEFILGKRNNEEIKPETYMDQVYSKWASLTDAERKNAIEKYRLKHFGKRNLELTENSKDWYKLLYISVLGSMGRVRPETNQIFVSAFMKLGELKDNNLQYNSNPLEDDNPKKWMDYMIMNPVNENAELGAYEEWRKYLPAFAQISAAARLLYHLFTTIPEGNETYYSRLDVEHDPEFSNIGLKGPNFKHTLGKYYPIILRELCSNDIAGIDNSIREVLNKESFFPTRIVREKLGLDQDTKKNSDAFYDKCRNFIKENSEYTEYLNDGMYPFYYYENKESDLYTNGQSIFDIESTEE